MVKKKILVFKGVPKEQMDSIVDQIRNEKVVITNINPRVITLDI